MIPTQKKFLIESENREGGFADFSSLWAYKTREGVIWICTSWNGNHLYRMDPYHNNISGNNIENYISGLLQDSAGVLWIATNDGLIRNEQEKNNTKRFVHDDRNPNSLSDNNVTAICQGSKRIIWIGSKKGVLNRLDTKTNTFTNYRLNNNDNRTLNTNTIQRLFEDKKGTLWIGTDSGLYRMNPESETFKRCTNNPNDRNNLDLTEGNSFITGDKTGNLWIGQGHQGLYRYNPQTNELKHYLSHSVISGFLQDSNGTSWAGTDGGLFWSKDQINFSRFTLPETEMPIRIVHFLFLDNQDNLLVGTPMGILRLNAKRNITSIYSKNDGLTEQKFIYASSYMAKNGKLFFWKDSMYYGVSLDQLTPNPGQPQVVLTKFHVHDQKEKKGNEYDAIDSVMISDKIILSYDQNTFSIDFAAIHFTNPEDNKHLFKLENYDSIWRQSGSLHTAYFYYVPPGHYIFRVKGISSVGVAAEKSIEIIINPPWWRTWLAYCMYGLFFIAAIYGIDRFQKNRLLQAERERSRAKELAQAKEIEKAYTELKSTQSQLIQSEKMASLGALTAGIAHEIQNPLNFVNNFSEVNTELIAEMEDEIEKGNLNEIKAIAKDIKENEQKINHHGKRADAIVKGMLQHSQSSSGVKEPTNINVLADEYLRLSYHGLRSKDKLFNATLQTHFDETIGNINIIPQDIARVLLNLYNNAFYAVAEKEMQADESYEPNVSVSTKKINDKVEIKVSDNGNGIPQKIVDKIFQPFFTTKPTGQGTGLGLSLSYDIVKAHGGEIKVETKDGKGAEFIIQLPVI